MSATITGRVGKVTIFFAPLANMKFSVFLSFYAPRKRTRLQETSLCKWSRVLLMLKKLLLKMTKNDKELPAGVNCLSLSMVLSKKVNKILHLGKREKNVVGQCRFRNCQYNYYTILYEIIKVFHLCFTKSHLNYFLYGKKCSFH